MIDKHKSWLWAFIEEYKEFEPKMIELLKTSLRYTWEQYVSQRSKLHIPGLYVIINKTNDRVYAGRSINIAKRLSSHKRSLLKDALSRGDEIIVRIIPCEVGSETWWMERVLIKYYDLRYTSLNVQSLIYVRSTDDLSQFKREDYDA